MTTERSGGQSARDRRIAETYRRHWADDHGIPGSYYEQRRAHNAAHGRLPDDDGGPGRGWWHVTHDEGSEA